MNKKLVLATIATVATVATAQGVYADEPTGTLTTGNETTTAGNTETREDGNQVSETTGSSKQEQPQGNDATETERGATGEREGTNQNATEITKLGDQITVTNPEVTINQSNGTGKYQNFTVEYKNVHFPDDMQINEGDKVTFDLPKEVKFETSYEFDVKNPENNVVGKATADATTNKVTTVFNDYFATHPLNKQMSLKLDAQWTDKVESGKPVTVNFNGTVVTAQIGAEQVIGKDELLAKWGSQDKDDPTVINWTVRLNYARKVLNYVTIIDEMSENQKLVDNYFEIKNIESLDPWIDKGSAMDLVKSISKSDHGFTIKMDRLDHMIYINYKTKLVNAVKDSNNPTNKIELKAETDGATSYSYVQLVGGKGDASGENKPVWEIPNEAPVYDKPSIDLKDIPLMPPAPIVEIPEWQGGTVPFDAPILEKPEINIEDIPMMPPAPILEKPELIIDIPEPKHDEPKPQLKTDKSAEINSKPSSTSVEPLKEQVNVIYQPTETNAHTLPNTGTESALLLSFAGMFILSSVARIALKREGE